MLRLTDQAFCDRAAHPLCPGKEITYFRVVHDHEYWNKFGLDEVYHTYAALLEVNCISPHQVLLERKIDDFSHKEAGDAIAAPVMILPDLTPSLSLSCFEGERTRTSYTEGCLYGGLSVCIFLSFFWDWINFSSLPDGLRQFLCGDHNPFYAA